ncbi:DUF1289 domain-containing protein [Rheinheimera pacifica]|uniref:DUF1289 domain-containing protein n=1 Tax=Rheinheimera pacifica TaxID=173990 RepID=UPI0021673483|nr:DUF1289 domain-containing protein [Rheinheimera pacifica]
MRESPCVRNCCLDQHDCCLGCGRLLNEIVEWHSADSIRRDTILILAAQRLTQRQQLYVIRHPAADPSG